MRLEWKNYVQNKFAIIAFELFSVVKNLIQIKVEGMDVENNVMTILRQIIISSCYLKKTSLYIFIKV